HLELWSCDGDRPCSARSRSLAVSPSRYLGTSHASDLRPRDRNRRTLSVGTAISLAPCPAWRPRFRAARKPGRALGVLWICRAHLVCLGPNGRCDPRHDVLQFGAVCALGRGPIRRLPAPSIGSLDFRHLSHRCRGGGALALGTHTFRLTRPDPRIAGPASIIP